MNTTHPLLKEFFTVRDDFENSIRIHCPTEEDRRGLVELTKTVVQGDFNTSEIDIIRPEDRDYVYFFWRSVSTWALGSPATGVGFDAFNWPNDTTYEFAEFMNIINCDMPDEIDGVSDLL